MIKKTFIFLVAAILVINLTGCGNIETQMKKAGDLMEKEEYDKAIEIYEEIIEKKPTYGKSYLELVNAYEKIGSLNLIEETLNKGIENVGNGKDRIPLKLDLVDYYIKSFEYVAGETLALEVLEEDDRNIQAYEGLLEIYDQQKEYKNVKSTYEEHMGELGSNKGILYVIKTYLTEGDRDTAEELMETLDKENVEDIPLLYALDFVINNEEQLNLIESQTGDINGDGKEENVLLLASNNYGMESEIIEIVIQDVEDGSIIDTISLSDFMGLPYNLKLVDGDGDNIKDILVSVHSGGSSDARVHKLFSYRDNETRDYFDCNSDTNCTFLDDYKAKVFSEEADKSYTVDFDAERIEWYFEGGYYDEDGKSLDPNAGGLQEFDVDPVFIPELNRYGLKAKLALKGPAFNGDDISYFEEIRVYDDGEWRIHDLYPIQEKLEETHEEDLDGVEEGPDEENIDNMDEFEGKSKETEADSLIGEWESEDKTVKMKFYDSYDYDHYGEGTVRITMDDISMNYDFEILSDKEMRISWYEKSWCAEYYFEDGDLWIDGKRLINISNMDDTGSKTK